MSEYELEPIPGLPGVPPEGERILWQGSPDFRHMVANAWHIRLTLLYFAAIIAWLVVRGDGGAALVVAAMGVAAIALFIAFAWAAARTSIYTLTNRRLVLRIGVALNKCVNLPLSQIESADLKAMGGGHGSIVLSLKGAPRLGYPMLWPHARSLRIVRPQPMLRAIPDAAGVARTLFRAVQQIQPVTVKDASNTPVATGPYAGAGA
ncbi:photosynthetic complex putative assembly protein PuhB [Sphingomonas sp. FW199]|uniref:photosynthetic complex putative assembly protein PuhB n=1 Tax=Sphingomonas sp. FW199 TaxID=3400217 RepID=UPI003CF91CCE